MAASSNNTLGFWFWTVAFAALAITAQIAGRWYGLRCANSESPWRTALGESLWPSIFTVVGFLFLIIVALCTFVVLTVFRDHQFLISSAAALNRTNRDLEVTIESKRQNLHTSDPAFLNTMNMIRAFKTYRATIGSAPCMILITTPRGENASIFMPFVSLAVVSSNCSNGELSNIGIAPENLDVETQKGMVTGKIILHAPPRSTGADKLEGDLRNLIQTERVYTLPGKAPKETVWIQFGPHTKWNTEVR